MSGRVHPLKKWDGKLSKVVNILNGSFSSNTITFEQHCKSSG